MKSLAKLADMGKRGEKIDVFAEHKGRAPNRRIKEKRRNENRAIQKRARQRLKREMYEKVYEDEDEQ